MKKTILTLLLLSSNLLALHAQSWLWARQGRNNNVYNDAHSIAIDNFHNAYLTGRYTGDTLILNSDTLFGNNCESFLVKYDENGNLLWARSSLSQTPSGFGTQSQCIATDNENNVYITGDFEDSIYFQSFSLKNNYKVNSFSVFLVKYDENGNVLWAKQSKTNHGSYRENIGETLITDKSGNVYVAGNFYDTVSFDSDTLKGGGNYGNMFLVKYSPAGNILWAKQPILGKSAYNSCGIIGSNTIAIDKSGHLYVTGYFSDTAYFGAQRLTSTLEDASVVKYDSNGNVIWAKQSNNANSLISANAAYSICTDNQSNVYIAGNFADTINFGAITLIGPYTKTNIFWAKYDSSGNVLWAKQSYDLDSTDWQAWDINTDDLENLYITGFRNLYGYGKVETVFDSDTLRLKKACSPAFFIKLDSSGTVLNNYLFQSSVSASGLYPMAVDSSGCYVYFGEDEDTSLVFGTDTIGPVYGRNTSFKNLSWPFIARWSDGKCSEGDGINALSPKSLTVNLYPNPNNGKFTIVIASEAKQSQSIIEIYNMLGEKVYDETLPPQTPEGALNVIDLISKASGVYLYRITDQQSNLISSGKFIIQ